MNSAVLVTCKVAVESNSRLVEALVVMILGTEVVRVSVGVVVVGGGGVIVTDGVALVVVVNPSVVLVAFDGLEVVNNVVNAVGGDVPLVNSAVVIVTVGFFAAVTVTVMSVTFLIIDSGLNVVGVGDPIDE